MRKWILVALVGLVLLYIFRLREGVDESLNTPAVAKCNTYWDGALTNWSQGLAAGPAPTGVSCMQYAPSWIQTASTSGTLLKSDDTPTADTKAAATANSERAAANVAAAAREDNYATASGYAALAEAAGGGTGQGPLPSAIDARASNTDSPASRPSAGPVFEDSGPFSGNAGTGQGTASGAAGPLNGNNTYGPPGTTTTMDPYDFWPGTKKSGTAPRAPPGTKQPVGGPTFGGTGVSIMSGSRSGPRSEPALYGPGSGSAGGGGGSAGGFGWGSMKSNSGDTSMLPSFTSAGSEPENQYAVTSRAPGDQDFYPPMFAQSSTYSLANASMKTDPVPFLSDFSVFQN